MIKKIDGKIILLMLGFNSIATWKNKLNCHAFT